MSAPLHTNGTNGHTNGVYHETDADLDVLYSWMPPQAPAAPACPEALFSLTLKGQLDGIEALFTVRGQTAAEFKANLAAVRGLLDQPQPQTPPAPRQPGEGWCAQHQVQMKWYPAREGKAATWLHKTSEGKWCRGR